MSRATADSASVLRTLIASAPSSVNPETGVAILAVGEPERIPSGHEMSPRSQECCSDGIAAEKAVQDELAERVGEDGGHRTLGANESRCPAVEEEAHKALTGKRRRQLGRFAGIDEDKRPVPEVN